MMVLTIREIIITNYYRPLIVQQRACIERIRDPIIFFCFENCPRLRAYHDSFVSNADRAEIHEIRGPPHRCEVSIVVTQLDVQCSAYRIADHWFEIDTSFLTVRISACVSNRVSIYFLQCKRRKKLLPSLTFFARDKISF